MFASNFAPAGWAFCDGQLLAISENDALFSLIGTTYGGDGEQSFALPNLQSRIPVHTGGPLSYVLGASAGVEQVTLTTPQIAAHTHPPALVANQGGGTTNIPATNTILADCNTSTTNTYLAPFVAANQVNLNAAITPTGGSQPHYNIQPSLAISYIIALFGIYPSPS